MFGYVTICKDCIDDTDYKAFMTYYCGLCKAMGKEGTQASRLGLSYDITFLAIVLGALIPDEPKLYNSRCIAHPIKKHMEIHNDRAINYAANMGIMLSYLKFLDDWKDDRSIKALFLMLVYLPVIRRIKKRYRQKYDEIYGELKRLGVLEKQGANVDEAADCFSKILETLFKPDFIEDKTTLRILGWFGYNIGRWIYVIDAYNDMEKDFKSKSYNPFLIGKKDVQTAKNEVFENTKTALTMNLAELSTTYELLKVYRNDGLIRHIIYTGLRQKQAQILENNNILGEENESV
ncbi:MAG: hypothetical protein IJT23_00380 [Clostridia bacterium]|nr:hypothetical protein [Clostridia bacterium]